MKFARMITLALLFAAVPVAAEEPPEPVTTAAVETPGGPGLIVRGQTFGDWDARFWEGDSFNQFALRRAEVGAGMRWPDYGGFFVNVEGVRSAAPDSLLGVDGNSIVLRVKHAYAFGEPEIGPGNLILQAGLVEDAWIARVESGFGLRGHDAVSSERVGYFETSDLGATVGYDLLDELVALRVSVTNGEGRNEVELNRGKNTTTVLSSVPVKFDLFGDQARPGLHVGYRDGSLGVGRARNHRVFGALVFDHPRLGLGVEFVRALGVVNDPGLEGQVLGAWLRGEPLERWLGAFFRFEQLDSDLESDDDTTTTLQAGLYSDLLRHRDSHVRLYLAGELVALQQNAPEVPGVPDASGYQAIRLTIDATGLFDPTRTEE